MSENAYRIVVGYDFSSLADLALVKAFELASREPVGEVHVLNVLIPMLDLTEVATAGAMQVDLGPNVSDTYAALESRVGQAMSKWQTETGRSFSRLTVHVRTEIATSEVAQLASDLDAELVVVGTHGRRGIRRLLLGSVAEAVVRQAPCPVLVVRPKAPHPETPKIEPPCPKCVEARKSSGGAVLWCEQHSQHHGQRHTYHYTDRVAVETNPSSFPGLR
jgi:nucleotide-binding universal stress UspA family protein